GDCPGDPIENPCTFSTSMYFYHCSNNPSYACVTSGQCVGGAACNVGPSPYGGDGKVAVCGSNGDDTMNGSEGDDIICGKAGADTIDGKNGNDIIYGDSGNDTI